jgi:GT2 family glycosyltransferase
MSDSADLECDGPKISVIIPFLNNVDEVVEILRNIKEQNQHVHPEIIVVDNGSVPKPNFSSGFLEQTIVISEGRYLNSPYSARNRGVERASGSVLVFVDANSLPSKNWLEQGLKCMEKTGADIVAGCVEFDFGSKPSAAKVVDAMTSIDQQQTVKERKAAFTANLFVKRDVFDSVGMFEEGVRSGGDVRWTTKATKAGHTISYCPDAVVLKKARSYRALLKKRVRTGKGYLYTWLKEEHGNVWFYNFLRSLKPPSPADLEKKYRKRYNNPLPAGKTSTWMVFYVMGIVEQLSFMTEYLRYNLGSGRNESKQREIERNIEGPRD